MNEPGPGNAEHLAHAVDRTVPAWVTRGSPEGTKTLNRPIAIAYVGIAGCSLTLVPGRLKPTSLYAPVQEKGRVRKDPACVLSASNLELSTSHPCRRHAASGARLSSPQESQRRGLRW